MNKHIEVEGGELALKNSHGDIVIVPKKNRLEVEGMIKDKCWSCIDAFVDTLPVMSDYAEDGLVVSELYKQKTGKDWSTAKQEGLTDGSYASNMKLRTKLLEDTNNKTLTQSVNANSNLLNDISKLPSIDKQNIISTNNTNNTNVNNDIDTNTMEVKGVDFNDAFKKARDKFGPNKIFQYNGKKYGTNLKGESFEPDEEVLKKHNLNNPVVKERLVNENKLVKSIYSTKATVKLEPEYKDWKDVKSRRDEINKMDQSEIIKQYHKNSNEEYLILDKKRGKMHLYKGDKEIASYNVGVGENKGDEQTKTVIEVYNDKNEIVENKEAFDINGKLKQGYTSKIAWSKGNKQSGAGIYTVSNVTKNNPHYSNAPSWNFKNEQGIEVPMAIHGAIPDRIGKITDNDETNNRVSNGCINGICKNLTELYNKGYGKDKKLYVLPDDDNNKYTISNGKIIFTSKDNNVNRTTKTLNYKPIIIENKNKIDGEADNMIKGITTNKQQLMKDLKINGDVFNDIAELTMGIAGQESNYGKSLKYYAKTNLVSDIIKINTGIDIGSTDVAQDILKSITGNKSYNSKGLTQIKYKGVNSDVKSLFDKYDITEENLNKGDKAAIAQIIIMAYAYNNELPKYRNTRDDKYNVSDMDMLLYINQGKHNELKNKTATPEKNLYIQSVKRYANNFNLKELN